MSLDITLWSKQQDFVSHPSHSLLFNAGIGSGKMYCGAVRSLLATQGYIGNKRAIATPNWGMVTAPTYSMLRDGPIETFLALADDYIDDYHKSEYKALMKNGSTVLFRSVENVDRRRGVNISWWWGDEAAMYPPVTWNTMIGRLRQGGKRGYRWLTTTPRGRDWLWQKFVSEPMEDPTSEAVMIQAKTWENPFLEDDVIADFLKEFGDNDFARQELWGEFIAHQGLIYSAFNEKRHTFRAPRESYPTVEAGVDWGFRNPGVIEVGGITNDGDIDIIAEEYQRQRDIEEWVETAIDLQRQHNITRFWCDPSSPDNIRKFREAGLNAVPANNEVLPGINAVKRLLNLRPAGLRIHETAAIWLIKEMRDLYQWEKQRGLIMPENPLKVHDHACDALRYLVRGVASGAQSGTLSMDVRRVL